MKQCALAFLFFYIERAVVSGESPVSNSESNLIYNKKDQAEDLFFRFNSVQFGAANRNCKKQNDNHTH